MNAPLGTTGRLPVVILISGGGSNMRTIAEAAATGRLNVEVRAVISDRADAGGLATAASMGIAHQVISSREFATREAFDTALADAVERYRPELVVLAGFMKILGSGFVERFAGRVLNIHPSLLPKYPGLHTHRRALAAGDAEHGATVHFVTAQLDGGPPIMQIRVPVLPDDTESSLAARVLRQEHRLYPEVLQLCAAGRLQYANGSIRLDGQELSTPLVFEAS